MSKQEGFPQKIVPPKLVKHTAGEPLDISQMPTKPLPERGSRSDTPDISHRPTTRSLPSPMDLLSALRKKLARENVEEGKRLVKDLREQSGEITRRQIMGPGNEQ